MHPISRRECIAALAATPLLGAQGSKTVVAGHPQIYMAGLPKYKPYEIPERIFADMHAAGLDGIELKQSTLLPDNAVARIRELSKRYQLPVLGTTFTGEMWDRQRHASVLEDARLAITRVAAMGGRTIGISVGNPKQRKTADQLDAQGEMLRKVIAICNDNGVVLNLHNHTHEVEDGEYDLKGSIERVPDVKLGPDINWLIRAGVDPLDFIARHGKRIVFAHLRDQKADGKWSEALGEGATDYAAVAAALRKAGFRGDLGIELSLEAGAKPTRPYSEDFAISRKYVRRVMGW